MSLDHLFVGQIVHTKSIDEFEIFTNGFVAVKNGKVAKIGKIDELEKWRTDNEFNVSSTIYLSATQFLLPGFIDCHIHAPQMPNIGLGLDKPLLQWLESYTFPLEYEYKDQKFAQQVYEKVVQRTLTNGTTFATYFGTIHESACMILAEEVQKQGQRALVGKSCCNCSTPDYYIETTRESLDNTRKLVENILKLNDPLVQPIILPRFAICCDSELMHGLALIAQQFNLHIQTHISENLDEVKYIEEKHKKSYSLVYDEVDILTKKCTLAHGVHLKDNELELLSKRGTSVVHCPASNIYLSSGICDVRRLLNAGIIVGLGTDVSGGNSSSILTTIRDTLSASHHLNFVKKQLIQGTGSIQLSTKQNENYKPLNYKEVLYLATMGGAMALQCDSIVGNFIEGKDFDALVIDVDAGQIDSYNLPQNFLQNRTATDHLLALVQKFVYVGDDRNIKEVYVKGRQVKS